MSNQIDPLVRTLNFATLTTMHLEKLPRYPLAQLPTPIQSLPVLTRALGGPELLIKRAVSLPLKKRR